MSEWRMTGTYFKSCNCDPGCPCDFMSPPTHHKCEGVLGMKVDEGHFENVSLNGAKWAVAYRILGRPDLTTEIATARIRAFARAALDRQSSG